MWIKKSRFRLVREDRRFDSTMVELDRLIGDVRTALAESARDNKYGLGYTGSGGATPAPTGKKHGGPGKPPAAKSAAKPTSPK